MSWTREHPVAVVGLGVAGAAVAVGLARLGYRVVVFERSAATAAQGGGIILQPSGAAVLRELGLLAEVVADAASIRRMEATRAAGAMLVGLDYAEVAPGCRAYGLTRGTLVEVLRAAALRAGAVVECGQPVAALEQDGQRVFLTVGGARRGPFRFVVAADGVRSRLRSSCRLPTQVHSPGQGSLWVTLPGGPDDGVQRHFVRDGRLLGLLPVGGGRTTLFWGLHQAQREAWQEGGLARWQAEVAAIDPSAGRLLGALRSLDEVRFARHGRVCLDPWFDRRVVFVGDAAHAVGPHLGQGANLALLDAGQLTRSLAACPDVRLSFPDFARHRRRQVRFYSGLSRLLALVLEAPPQGVAWARDRIFAAVRTHPWSRRQMARGMAGLKSGWLRD